MRNDSFTTSWLAARLGADPAQIDARRRAGELLSFPVEGGLDHVYPAWQFDTAGNQLPAVSRMLAVARETGVAPFDLDAFLNRRAGVGGPRMWELLLDGREDFVVSSLRSAA
jgi:hypothetical protein